MSRTKLKRKRTSVFKTFYILLVILLLVVFARQEWNIYKVRTASKEMSATVGALEQKQGALKQEIGNLHDLSYVERVARSEYKMIKPNEIPIIIRE